MPTCCRPATGNPDTNRRNGHATTDTSSQDAADGPTPRPEHGRHPADLLRPGHPRGQGRAHTSHPRGDAMQITGTVTSVRRRRTDHGSMYVTIGIARPGTHNIRLT